MDTNLITIYEISGYDSASFVWQGEERISISEMGLNFGLDINKRPKSLDLYISEDGINWSRIWSYNVQYEGLKVGFSTQRRCRYVKLTLHRADGAKTIALAEWQLTPFDLGDFSTFDQVVANGSSFTHNDSTPMGNHYADRHVTTDEDKV